MHRVACFNPFSKPTEKPHSCDLPWSGCNTVPAAFVSRPFSPIVSNTTCILFLASLASIKSALSWVSILVACDGVLRLHFQPRERPQRHTVLGGERDNKAHGAFDLDLSILYIVLAPSRLHELPYLQHKRWTPKSTYEMDGWLAS